MLSPSSSSGSIRDRRRVPMHPGVRVPFPDFRRSQPQGLKDAVHSQPTTIGQAIDQISYLINDEIYRFDELASSVKNVYGVDLAYGNSHVGLRSMLSKVSLDVPYGYDVLRRGVNNTLRVLHALVSLALMESLLSPAITNSSRLWTPSMSALSLHIRSLSRLNPWSAPNSGISHKRRRYRRRSHWITSLRARTSKTMRTSAILPRLRNWITCR